MLDLLHYDAYRRGNFLDHWLSPTATVVDFSRQGVGTGSALSPYEARVEGERGTPVLLLQGRAEQAGASLHIDKRFRLLPEAPRLTVEYRLGPDGLVARSRFGVELNLAFYMGPPPDRVVEINGQRPADPSLFAVAETPGVREVRIVDAWLGLAARLALDPPGTLWRCPVQTISQSEAGYERVAQQVALLPHWPLGGAEDVRDLTLSLSIETWEAAGG